MVLSKILSTNKLKLGGRSAVEVDELDRALDVDTSRFHRTAVQLTRQLAKSAVDVNVAGYRTKRTVAVPATGLPALPDVRGGFYQVELRRIPAMDREEEFRMARRYEFMKLRVQLELERLGVEPGEAQRLATRPVTEVHRALAPNEIAGYLARALEQLEDLRNLYVEGALHIVLGTVARYRGLGVDTADLIQEGNASLFSAIEGFDWRRDVRFRTYAQYWVQQAVLKLLYNSSRTVRIPVWVQKILGRIRKLQDEGRRAGTEISHAEIGRRLGIPEEKVTWVLATKRYAVSLDAERGDGDGLTLAQMLADESAESVPDAVPEGDLAKSLGKALGDLPPREQLILRRRFGLGGAEPETLGDIAKDLGITAERVRQLQNAALERLQKPAKLRQLASFVE